MNRVSTDRKKPGMQVVRIISDNSIDTRPADRLVSSEVRMTRERRLATVLFSDVSGYTAMSEKLDPEEIKDIMSMIFGAAGRIVDKYQGYVDKFIGDAVMCVFGVPKSHEDDAARALRAAMELHDSVRSIGRRISSKTGFPLTMHTGIGSGLILTDQADKTKGTETVLGDTINVASRLEKVARADEIVVDRTTFEQTERFFDFIECEPLSLKGRSRPIHHFRMLSAKRTPKSLRRCTGPQSDLVGRDNELTALQDAVRAQEKKGVGRVVSICGEAGIGKSRLVQEFRKSLDADRIQWLEAFSFGYAQHIPYSLWRDLFGRMWHILENDSAARIREKVERGVSGILGRDTEAIPFIGMLFGLQYERTANCDPAFAEATLRKGIGDILSILSNRKRTILCFEDLQWADDSSVELLRMIAAKHGNTTIFLCVHRPPFTLFDEGFGPDSTLSLVLKELSRNEISRMLSSLLRSPGLSRAIGQPVMDKTAGNPFYVEELINNLLELEKLVRKDDGTWVLAGHIDRNMLPSSIQKVIAARLDRLPAQSRRTLQVASVIGSTFFHDVLSRVSDNKVSLGNHLELLIHSDLIRTCESETGRQYTFKHALVQDVAYDSLLKAERKRLHTQIGTIIEQVFPDRLPEFYETLAYHFRLGERIDKATHYLSLAADKNLRTYALQQSHEYYKEAVSLLTDKPDLSIDERIRLVKLINRWLLVFYFRGDNAGSEICIQRYREIAESLGKSPHRAMFLGWMGWTAYAEERLDESYNFLSAAIRLAQEVDYPLAEGHACAWLTYTCEELCRYDEALRFGERAQSILKRLPNNHYIFYKSLGGIGIAYVKQGELDKAIEVGERLLQYGREHSNPHALSVGNVVIGYARYFVGDYESIVNGLPEAIATCKDPLYRLITRLLLGLTNLALGRWKQIKDDLLQAESHYPKYGIKIWHTLAVLFLGIRLVYKGELAPGLKQIRRTAHALHKSNRQFFLATAELSIGTIYAELACRSKPVPVSFFLKNALFLLLHAPFAASRAEKHFRSAVKIGERIGAKCVVGMAKMELGSLYLSRGRKMQARTLLCECLQIFERQHASGYITHVKIKLANMS